MTDIRDLGLPRAALSPADPDALARAVRAHKAGDAVTQAVITLVLALAIGAVAFVLTADRAAAAGLLRDGALAQSADLMALLFAGAALLLAARPLLRVATAPARARRR